jgi:DNA-binding CsgD family transcriptional regulator
LANIKKLVLPYVENMKYLRLNDNQMAQLKIIETHLNDIISAFLHNLTSEYFDLTPREIQVANLVKEGKTTKEITQLLNISATAVDFHRKNLRSKVGIKNKKSNLRSHLLSLRS